MRVRTAIRRRGGWLRLASGIALLAAIAVAACGRATRGEIHLADALERLALGDSAGALALLEQARFDLPRDDRVLFHYGRLQAVAGGDAAARARGERALRAAVDRAPDVGIYRESLGLLLQEQGFHYESMAELRRALQRDPGLGRAWCGLGRGLLREWREDPHDEALRDSTLRCFEHALAADPHDREARYALAALWLFGVGAVDVARDIAAAPVATGGCETQFQLLQVAIEARARRFAVAYARLRGALECMLPDERAAWTGIDGLIHPDSVSAWALYTQSWRDSISEAFWFGCDPTPATPANERLAEHVSRRVEADFLFAPWGRNKEGHATDRGETFVRWGPPAIAVRDAMRPDRVWLWEYPSYGGELRSVLFVDVYLNGDYVRARRGAWSDFSTPEPFAATPQVSGLDFGDPGRAFQWLAARFRADAGRTAVHLVFEAAEESTGVALRAAAWNGPRQLAGELDVPESRGAVLRHADHIVGVARLLATPPASEIALQVRATGGVWRSAGRRELEVQSADADTLEMSDLLPAHVLAEGQVADPRQAVPVPRADSLVHGERLHVYFEIYPSRSARAAQRTLDVAYRVDALPPRWRFRDQFSAAARARRRGARAAVQSTFMLRARHEREPQRLSVDLGRLEPGPYLFSVTVQDPATGARTERILRFAVGEPDRAVRGS